MYLRSTTWPKLFLAPLKQETPAEAKTRMIVLAPDAAPSKDALFKEIVETVAGLAPGEKLLVYSARPIAQIASIELPNGSGMSQAPANRLAYPLAAARDDGHFTFEVEIRLGSGHHGRP